MIIAGQTSGTNIYHTDYIPDSTIIAEQENIDGFNLDLDGNGTDDLYFNVGIANVLPYELRTWSTVKLLNSNIKICLNADGLNWIDKLGTGDTISENNIWGFNTDTVYYFHKYHYWTYPPPGGESWEGDWPPSGYLGFQMIFPDETFYGWINMEIDDFTITAKESAIRGLTVGTSEIVKSDDKFYFYPNPCSNLLTVESNFTDYKNKRIEILNLNGKISKTSDILGDKTIMDTKHLAPGIYLIRIKEGEKIISQTKFLKI
jgi:hypothetical protein